MIFFRHAMLSQNEAFIIDDKHYTYAQLGEITASITHSLSEIKDEKIGIVAENRIETYAAILAVLAGGKTYVILHPAYPQNSRSGRTAYFALYK